jgi:hypothetical protein
MARGLFCCAVVLVVCVFFPARSLAEQTIRALWTRLFHLPTSASTEESALAPVVPVLPSSQNIFRAIHSRYPHKRLEAIEAIRQAGNASPQAIEALVKSTQDKNVNVSRRATETLIGLCRSGHEEGVVWAFARATHQPPRIVQKVVHTGYAFKIPDRAEEQRVQDVLNKSH